MTTPTATWRPAPANPARTDHRLTAIGWWLLLVAVMILAMVVIGGVTRLTESGLSITTWQPIGGIIPPLNGADWNALFEAYRQSPQYRLVNSGMSLAEFRTIFWWEYVHRLWGRLIGFAFAVPFAWFLVRRQIPGWLTPRLVMLFVLGGLQGVLGWWMVASGLEDVPWVSPYRLTAHLGLAVLLYAVVLWTAFQCLASRTSHGAGLRRLARFSGVSVGLIGVTILAGGFVAGLDAGMIYNTFPTMNGTWLPPDYVSGAGWRSPFESPAAAQFNHRWLGLATLAAVLGLWWHARRFRLSSRSQIAYAMSGLMAAVQVGLGVATLLTQVALPAAATHQAGALLLLSAVLWARFTLGRGQAAA
ncbi:MAG: COX15/CtaA family protein [Alphaproteobacteria bacterium]